MKIFVLLYGIFTFYSVTLQQYNNSQSIINHTKNF